MLSDEANNTFDRTILTFYDDASVDTNKNFKIKHIATEQQKD